jgi:membrane protease YdiL (CAAX protease family)
MSEAPMDDRSSNLIGAAGFALGATTLLFVLSAGAAFKELPAYLGCATCIGLPTALVGLVCSIIGSLRKGRPKLFSILGIAVGALLVLGVLPSALLMLQRGP